jgi:hypothetical protein
VAVADFLIRASKVVWAIFLGFASPTRVVAALLIKLKVVRGLWGVLAWNVTFYALATAFCAVSAHLRSRSLVASDIIFAAFGYLAVSRIGELLIAFYGDAIDRLKGKLPRLDLPSTDRVTLLVFGYIETIVQFGILHFCIAFGWFEKSYSKPFRDILESIYFSGVTITTTGFGDIAPANAPAQIATLCEAVIGVVFIAVALAVYLSSVQPKRAD